MARAIETQRQEQRFSAYALEAVLDKPIEGETPQSRLKQVGMMTVLYMMYRSGQKLTLANIKETTGMTRNTVKESIDPLVARGILKETIVKNSAGRGTAWLYEFAAETFDRLGLSAYR